MDTESINLFIRFILQFCRHSRPSLWWVIRQVAEEYTESASSLDDEGIISLLYGQHASEQILRSLLDALENVVIQTARMEEEIHQFFRLYELQHRRYHGSFPEAFHFPFDQAILHSPTAFQPSEMFSEQRIVVTPKNWTHPLIHGIVQEDGGHHGKTTQIRRRVQG